MPKAFKLLVFPIVLMILVLGVVLPILSTIRDERCSLAINAVLSSDPVAIRTADEILELQAESVMYLMKHAKTTLRHCINYEQSGTDEHTKTVIRELARQAYTELTQQQLPDADATIQTLLSQTNPKLYQELMIQ